VDIYTARFRQMSQGLNRVDTRREEITNQIFRQIKKSYSPTALLNPPPKTFQFSDDIKTYVRVSNPKLQENSIW